MLIKKMNYHMYSYLNQVENYFQILFYFLAVQLGTIFLPIYIYKTLFSESIETSISKELLLFPKMI